MRGRRLTMAPADVPECHSRDRDGEEDRLLAPTQVTSDPLAGFRSSSGSKFWPLATESDSEDDEDGTSSISSAGLIDKALAAGFTCNEVYEAELSLRSRSMEPSHSRTKTPTLAKKIVQTLTQNRKVKPWSGPLPPKRVSPVRTLGDAIGDVLDNCIKGQRLNNKNASPVKSKASSEQIASESTSELWPPLSPMRPSPVNSDPVKRSSNFKIDRAIRIPGNKKGKLSNMPKAHYRSIKYRPTEGLRIFSAPARVQPPSRASSIPEPRSYADVLRASVQNLGQAMNTNGGSSSGSGGMERTGYGNTSAQGRQGSSGGGGFPNQNQTFNPGYAGGHAWNRFQRRPPRPFRGAPGAGRGVPYLGHGYQNRQWQPAAHFPWGPRPGVPQVSGVPVQQLTAMGQTGSQVRPQQQLTAVPPPQVTQVQHKEAVPVMASVAGTGQSSGPTGEKGQTQNLVDGGSGGGKALEEGMPAPMAEVQDASKQAVKIQKPYCFRCFTKGHTMQECTAVLSCDICGRTDHATDRCAKLKGNKVMAIPCGFAVTDLGFYYIPDMVTKKVRGESLSATVKVIQGEMTTANVIAELERLVSNKCKWVVMQTGSNSFKTTFPSKIDLQRMVEWGVLHAKSCDAQMQIELRESRNEAKRELPKVWVQFTGLDLDHREFDTIWAVGFCLGVSKMVDMTFTEKYDICRIKVAVVDAMKIPKYLDVVIGDFLYGLKFRIEFEENDVDPQPLDMDYDTEDEEDGGDHGDTEMTEGGTENHADGNAKGPTNTESHSEKEKGKASEGQQQSAHGGPVAQGEQADLWGGHPGLTGDLGIGGGGSLGCGQAQPGAHASDGLPASAGPSVGSMVAGRPTLTGPSTVGAGQVEEAATADLFAVPASATPPSRQSKRRASSVDQDTMERAEKMKAWRDLETSVPPGN
ncbi:hypothetical protein ACP70R_042758 [Stipagrostis hirtigluma subsp. patula]